MTHMDATAGQLEKQLRESQALFEISLMLAGTVDLAPTLQQIAAAAYNLIPAASKAILHLVDESGSFLKAVAVADAPRQADAATPGSNGSAIEEPPMLSMNFKLGQGIAGLALASGQTIAVGDVLEDERYVHQPPGDPAAGRPIVRALLVAPVRVKQKILGTLSVHSAQPGAFTPDDERLLTTLGVQAALAIEKAQMYTHLQASLEQEKAARAQLVQMEKLAALGRIVAAVAHELNNPLQAIQNALYLVQMDDGISEQSSLDLQTILDETERMAQMIARLRDTYRPTSQENYQPALLNELVEDVQHLLASHLRRSQVTLEFSPAPDIPAIPLLRDQIRQVILNICLNAVEAMPDGGRIEIRTQRAAQGSGVELSIRDNGPGIDARILPYIFDPFVTDKDSGTGLGLAISYDIIRLHKGKIDVQSAANRGTLFTIWLPLEQLPDTRDQVTLQWH